jgi:hypothetical protein
MANEGVNISLLYGGVSFIVGLIGGLVWIFSAEKLEGKPGSMAATG